MELQTVLFWIIMAWILLWIIKKSIKIGIFLILGFFLFNVFITGNSLPTDVLRNFISEDKVSKIESFQEDFNEKVSKYSIIDTSIVEDDFKRGVEITKNNLKAYLFTDGNLEKFVNSLAEELSAEGFDQIETEELKNTLEENGYNLDGVDLEQLTEEINKEIE